MPAVTTDHHHIGLSCLEQSPQIFPATAMVWRHQQVTRWQSGSDEPSERLSFQVTRKEQAAIGCFDRQHKALLIIASSCNQRARERMKHSGNTLWVKCYVIASDCCSHRHLLPPQLLNKPTGCG
jgi:hypothetical protein